MRDWSTGIAGISTGKTGISVPSVQGWFEIDMTHSLFTHINRSAFDVATVHCHAHGFAVTEFWGDATALHRGEGHIYVRKSVSETFLLLEAFSVLWFIFTSRHHLFIEPVGMAPLPLLGGLLSQWSGQPH